MKNVGMPNGERYFRQSMQIFAGGLTPGKKICIDWRIKIHRLGVLSFFKQGLGVSILAELILHRTNYRLALGPTVPAVSRTIAAGYRDRNSLPIASKYFIDSLVKRAEELP